MAFHYVYKTTNLINNKFYIGAHYGKLNDNYFGSGTMLKCAVKKYGIENFKKEVLCICTNRDALYLMERIYVGQEEVDDVNCYNMKPGGEGGSTEYARQCATKAAAIANRKRTYPKLSQERKDRHSKLMKGRPSPNKGNKLSEEAKMKIGNAARGRIQIESSKKNTSEAGKRYWSSEAGLARRAAAKGKRGK